VGIAGFLIFAAIDIVLYKKIAQWAPARIERSWPWLAVAKVSAVAALIFGGYQIADDISFMLIAILWLLGGLVAVIWQRINYRLTPNVDWSPLLSCSFLLGSFFAAFGGLAVRASLAGDLTTVVTALVAVIIAAIVSLAGAFIGGMVYDGITNAANT